MTPNMLFDNIYVGHSVEDAKAFAAETFDVKHPLEEEESKSSKKKFKDDGLDGPVSFKDDPMEFIR